MWETVTIRKEAVEKFYQAEKGGRQALFITLNVPPSNLVAFCTSGDRHVRIVFDSRLDITTPAVTVFGKERARNSKYKASVSQINIQVHRDECDSPGPQRNIRSADESSETMSIQSAKMYGLEEGAVQHPSGPAIPPPAMVPSNPSGVPLHPSEPQGHSSRSTVLVKSRVGAAGESIPHKVSVPLSPMRTPSRAMSETSSVSSKPSLAHVSSLKPRPKKSDFIQPKTPVKPNPQTTAKRVKTPLQIVVGDKTNADSGNESATSFSSSFTKKASVSSGVSIGSAFTPAQLREKLLQVGKRCGETSTLAGGEQHQKDEGSKSDPGTSSSKKSKKNPTQQRRQLRSRGDDKTPHLRASSMSNLAGPQDDKPEVTAKHQKPSVEGDGGSTEAINTRKPSRKKFRLYSEAGMMMESDDGNQEKTDADMVIPSSIPTQGSIEVIPESLPPSGQPPQTEVDTSASRTLNKSSCIPPSSAAKSPSLSTLTEESAQTSNHSWSNKGTTPVMNVTDVESPVRQMLRPRATQKSPTSVLGNESHNRPNGEGRGDTVNQNARCGSSTSGLNDSSDGMDEESDADDEDDEQARASRKESSAKPRQKSKTVKDQPSPTDKTKATKNKKQDVSPKTITMPLSRAFRKVPTCKSPESSQDLSQLEFTSQMESHPKRGRPRKNAPKKVKGKKQVAQRGKPGKAATGNPEPKTRNRRAAAKMANEKILSQRQLGETTNSDSYDLAKSDCSTDDTNKSKGTNKAISSNARELTHFSTGKNSKASGISSRPTPSKDFNQGSHDLSVYDFIDLEEGRSQSKIRSPPYSVKASTTKDKSPPFLSASQNAQDISVYDFNDSGSTSTQGNVKQIRGRKKQPQSSKPAMKGVPQKKAPTNKPRKKQQKSPEALSDIERPRNVPRQKPQKTSTKYTLSPIEVVDEFVGSPITYEELSDIEQPQTASKWQTKKSSEKPAEEDDVQQIKVPTKKNTKRSSSSCEELSDIEQPRDAAPMRRGSLPQIPPIPQNIDSDEYCDEEVDDFIGTLTAKQRQYFERGLKIVRDAKITRKPKPATGKGLPQEVTRSLGMSPLIEKSSPKSKVIIISDEDEEENVDVTSAITSASKRLQEKPSRPTTPAVLSVSRNQQEKPRPSITSAVTSVSRIQKETACASTTPTITFATRNHQQDQPDPSVTPAIKSSSGNHQRERPPASTVLKKPREDNKSASSVSSRSFGSQIIEDESEENVAREFLRTRYGDDGSEEGQDADVMSVENFSKMCQKIVKKSGRGLAAARPRRNIPKINYQSQDSGSDSEEDVELDKEGSEPSSQEDVTPYSRKRRQDADDGLLHLRKRKSLESDAVSERSWLTEQPKQRVSTYSKSHNQEWVRLKSAVQLDTTVKKPRRQREKRTKMPPNQPKKKNQRILPDSDNDDVDSEGVSVYYYREESAGIANSQPSQETVNKIPALDKPRGGKNSTDQPISETEDLCPLTPSVLNEEMLASRFIADLVTPQLNVVSANSSRCNSIGKSPKQVTFDCDPESDEDLDLPNQEEDLLQSGPSHWPRPSSSSLKRKYSNLFTRDNEEEEEDVEDIYQEEAGRSEDVTGLSGQGFLRPKKLFKRGANLETDEDEDDAITSDGQMSSTGSMENVPTVHITHMLKAVGENLKQKMMTKQIQAQKLTEGAVKSTQRSVSNLWAKQLQARTKCQEEFKSVLLTEILSLENDLGCLQEQYSKMDAYLKQHQRKVASTLLQHESRVKSLQSQYEEDSRDLNHELGRHLLQSVKQVLVQEMVTMQKKLLQDSQHHELQQMKRGLQTMFMQ